MSQNNDIAIIGMSGRFPGANDIHTFWKNILNGTESISILDDTVLEQAGVPKEYLHHPRYVKAAARLSQIDLFDADFFGYSEREAELMDPQHRLFLTEVYHAIEDACIPLDDHSYKIGVFSGTSFNTYLFEYINEFKKYKNNIGSFSNLLHSNSQDYLSTKISYKLNLTGPSINVQTACSTSLAALHIAAQSLLVYESDIAIVGGVSVIVPQNQGYFYETAGICSSDGHCRAFDKTATGTIFGSGVGVVVLKRMEDALADRNQIYAIIKSTAMNNDGNNKVSYTAPSVEGQANVIHDALALSNINNHDIDYIETHGTGTKLGDSIEFSALQKVFSSFKKRNSCALGSVKTNIGHLNAAAGIAGLIKTALALKHSIIPPSLHFTKCNPEINMENSPFYINTETKTWPEHNRSKFAGVSSFGVGGTNVHVILEKAPLIKKSFSKKTFHLLPISAKTESALKNLKSNLTNFLSEKKSEISNIAYTLQKGRTHYPCRDFLICHNNSNIVFLENKPENNPDYDALLEIGRNWLRGDKINWESIYSDETPYFISLPTYPFEKKSYWIKQLDDKNGKEITYPSYINQNKNDGSIHEKLNVIWCQLLKIEKINFNDNFYSLGGDSLLGTQLLTHIEFIIPVTLDLTILDKNPTINLLSQFIESRLIEKINSLTEEEAKELLAKTKNELIYE